MFESLFEIIFIDILLGFLKFILKILSLVVLWVKNLGKKSVEEIWADKDGLNFTGLTFIAQVLTIILLFFIVFSIVNLIFVS